MARTYQSKIIIFRDMHDDFSWRLIGGNGHVICESAETYVSRRKCEEAVHRFRVLVVTAVTVESAEVL